MGYIHLFQTVNEFNSARTDNYVEPWLSYTKEASGLTLNKTEHEKLLEMPLTFEVISGGTIVWKASSTANTRTIEYKKNDGEWTSITSTTAGTSFNVNAGDKVQFRGDNAAYSTGGGYPTPSSSNQFVNSTAKFNVEGNIMSLIDSTGFSTATTIKSGYTFCGLFENCTGLTSAENFILPATGLANGCYEYLFAGCTSLTAAPALPATSLANFCYYSMFSYCSSLTTAPELPATRLAALCYYLMFLECSNLNYIKCLATDISAYDCTYDWVNGVQTTSGTFVKNPSMNDWTTGTDGIPTNWTVQDA